MLMDNWGDVSRSNDDDFILLHTACYNGHLDVVRLLVDKEADANRAADNSIIPLCIACSLGYLEVVRMLMDKGGEPSLALIRQTDCSGRSVF